MDVSLRSFDVAVRPDSLQWVVPYTTEGVSRFVKQINKLRPRLVVIEACGNLECSLARALEHGAIPVAVMNPRQIRDFAKPIGQLGKTDRLDAEVLSRFAEIVQLEPRSLPDEDEEQLCDLLTRRRQLVDMSTAEKNRLRRASPSVRAEIEIHLGWLNKELKKLARRAANGRSPMRCGKRKRSCWRVYRESDTW